MVLTPVMKKILIIQTASIGDVILSTPVAEKWHAHFPDDAIDVLVKQGNESLFVGHPFIRQVLVWRKSEKKYRHLLHLLRVVQNTEYDVIVNLQRFASSGFLTFFGRGRYSTGFAKNPFSRLFSKRFPHHLDGRHEVERNLSLLEGLVPEGLAPVRLYPPTEAFAKVSQYKTSVYITVSPASLWPTKQFPAEKWVEFLRRVNGFDILLTGGKSDAPLCSSIAGQLGDARVLNLAGKLSLMESAALMRDARMNFVNDSAPVHLASAVNAPVTAIFCSTVPKFGFGPLSHDSRVVETSLDMKCRPCGLHGHRQCPEKHFQCAYSIDINHLLKRLYE